LLIACHFPDVQHFSTANGYDHIAMLLSGKSPEAPYLSRVVARHHLECVGCQFQGPHGLGGNRVGSGWTTEYYGSMEYKIVLLEMFAHPQQTTTSDPKE